MKTKIISEIGINHNGDLDLCKQMIMASKVVLSNTNLASRAFTIAVVDNLASKYQCKRSFTNNKKFVTKEDIN